MPGRILSFLDRTHHSNASLIAFKEPFTPNAASRSTTSLSIEHNTDPKIKIKPLKPKKDKKEKEHGHPKERRDSSFTMDALRNLNSNRRHSEEQKRKSSPKPGKKGSCETGKLACTPKPEPERTAAIYINVESPPLLFIGPPTDRNGEDSSGALFSSQLQLNVLVPSISLISYETRLLCTVKHTHPVEKNCPDCLTKTTELKRWSHIPEGSRQTWTYKKGEHSKPLQYLFPGHLPASVHSSSALATLEYRLETIAETSTGEKIEHVLPLNIRRAIPPGSDKHSIRIFPPTNLTVNVHLNPIVHPIGEILVSMRMDGICDRSTTKDSMLRWRLRKLNWKIEEMQRMVSPACPKHIGKVGGEGKGVQHEDIRTVGMAEMKEGWKSDWDDGKIELEFKAAVNPTLKPTCDVEAPNGFSVTHALVLELVVAEEWAPKGRPQQHTPTGAARILRTQFNLVLTERMGMGIAWDQEMPPMYENVPPSPPTYDKGKVGDLDSPSMRELQLDGELEDLDQNIMRVPPMPAQQQPGKGKARLTADDLEVAGPSSSRRERDEEDEEEPSQPEVGESSSH